MEDYEGEYFPSSQTSSLQSSLDPSHSATHSHQITDPNGRTPAGTCISPNAPPESDHLNARATPSEFLNLQAPQETDSIEERQRRHHHDLWHTDSSNTNPYISPCDNGPSNITHQTWQRVPLQNSPHTGFGRSGPPLGPPPPQQHRSHYQPRPLQSPAPYMEKRPLPQPFPERFAGDSRYSTLLDCVTTQQPSLDQASYQDHLPSYQPTRIGPYSCLDRSQEYSESDNDPSFGEGSLQHGRYTETDPGFGSSISGEDLYHFAEGGSSRDPIDEGFYSSFGGNGSSQAQQTRTKQTSMHRQDSRLGLRSRRIPPVQTLSDVPCETYRPEAIRSEHDIAGVSGGHHGHPWGLATSNQNRHPDGPWLDSRNEVFADQLQSQTNPSYGDMEGIDPSLLNGFMVAESVHFARSAEGTASTGNAEQNGFFLGPNERDPSGDGYFHMDLGVSPKRGQGSGPLSVSGFIPQANPRGDILRNGSEISTFSWPGTVPTETIHPAPSATTPSRHRGVHRAAPPLASCPLCEADPNCQPKPEFGGDDVKTQRNTINKHNRVQHPARPHEYHCRLLDEGNLRCQSVIKGAQNRRRHVETLHPTDYEQLPPTDAGRRRPNIEANTKLDEIFEVVFT